MVDVGLHDDQGFKARHTSEKSRFRTKPLELLTFWSEAHYRVFVHSPHCMA